MQIHIDCFPIFVKLGYYTQERLTGQEVFVSLTAEVNQFDKTDSDDISDVVDYGQLIKMIESLLKDREIKFVESAIMILGNGLMDSIPKIRKLNLLIEKPVLPNGMGKGAKISVSHRFERN